MPLQLPNLDDLRWTDLVAEGKSLIPSSAPEWTNHNPSDPGVTLIELFAYVSETLLYQLNRITDSDTAEFLSLLQGPEWKLDNGLNEKASLNPTEYREILKAAVNANEKRLAVNTLRTNTRAVTSADFEALACAIPGVARAKCLPQRNLDNDDPTTRWQPAPGHVSVVVLTLPDVPSIPEVLADVRQALEPARLLTTRVHVVPAKFVNVSVQFRVTPNPNVHADDRFREHIARKLAAFLDPYHGWFDGKGWPLGRNLFISELYQRAGEIHGVETLAAVRDAQGKTRDEVLVDTSLSDRVVRNQGGEVRTVTLQPDELFQPQIEARNMTIARQT